MRQQNLLVVVILFIVLGGYAFFLQSKLTMEDAEEGFVRSKGFKGEAMRELATEAERAKLVALATEEELNLLKRTQKLAEEVAGLAKTLQERKDELEAKGQEAVAQARLAEKSSGLALPSSPPPPLADVQKAPRVQERSPTTEAVGGVNVSADTSTPAGKQAAIVAAMKHSWKGYADKAWGYDELMPLTQNGKNTFGGLGATIVDSLDTLWLMGLKDEFKQARDWVVNELSFNKFYEASVFETTIRVVGGILTAHELSGDEAFLRRAEELVKILMHAFDTVTGIPYGQINLQTQQGRNPTWTQKASILSEFGTEQLELIQTSLKTGNPIYAQKTEAVIKFLNDKYPDQGLLPLYIHPETGQATTQMVSLGAMGDSYYEYLLKVWIYKGRRPQDEMYRAMWVRAMDEMLRKLLFKNEESGYTYVAEFARVDVVKHKMDHLSCFIPAMLALGAHAGAVTGAKADKYLQVAEELTHTCWQMYHQMPSGLAPEYVEFGSSGMVTAEKARHNLLRPEALEAMFVLWRVTQKEIYREWAWDMFLAFERNCKVEVGYAGLKDVTVVPPPNDNTMQSFWLAETLKYLWLLFAPNTTISLDEWVLNTEAHPLRIVKQLPEFLNSSAAALSQNDPVTVN
ncbi:Mannosyl-oligosaccharide 1,2-alpha-mannosidase IA [Coccomyxa sp. Obi]|nr:Mannosyl-oligosaccharide 1,2-alpha-mannosidase IA [Coccomyxa sp. Obi]